MSFPDVTSYEGLKDPSHLHTGHAAIENALNNRRTRIQIREKQCFLIDICRRLATDENRKLCF